MPVEKSAGAIVFFRRPDGKIEYLLLQRRENSWGFPKGQIEKGENLETAARRETEEETGLKNLAFVDGFKETVRYFMKVKYDYQIERGFKFGDNVLKFVTYFLAESKSKNVKISFEHIGFEWLDHEEAHRWVLKTDKDALDKANEYLKNL